MSTSVVTLSLMKPSKTPLSIPAIFLQLKMKEMPRRKRTTNGIKRRRFTDDSSDPVCTEFDAYIRKADLSNYFYPVVNDMVSDSEFESQERDKQLERSSEEAYSSASDSEDSNSHNLSQLSVCLEKKKLEYSDSEVDTYQRGPMEKTSSLLFEVEVTVKASQREENVPFVSLNSQLNDQAILGHPVEIHVLKSDICQTSGPKKKSGFPPLVWKTAKRTPVCYVANSIYSPGSKNGAHARGNAKAVLVKEAKIRSCVTVGLIFSKILAGVGQLAS